MPESLLLWGDMRPVRTIVEDYDWIHTAVGLLGNLLFVVGSVLFLWRSTKDVGVWVFIAGSSFMFVGSAGDASIKLGNHFGHDFGSRRGRS